MRRLPVWIAPCLSVALLALAACAKSAPPQAAPQAMPVQTQTIAAAPVPQYDEYVSTIKSRRSATINPQVDGNLVRIYVHSGDRVRAGQLLMEIDPAKQEATVASSKATEQQKLAVFSTTRLKWSGNAISSTRASPAAMLSTRQSRRTKTPRPTTSLPSQPRRARESSSAITTSPLPLTASWAMYPCTWATMSLPRPCSPRWTKTAILKPTSISQRSA